MNILFVCSMGQMRSKTAAYCLKTASTETFYCGTSKKADITLSVHLINQADLVVFMDNNHYLDCIKMIPEFKKKHYIWNIPDDFNYMDDILVHRIRSLYSDIDPFYQ